MLVEVASLMKKTFINRNLLAGAFVFVVVVLLYTLVLLYTNGDQSDQPPTKAMDMSPTEQPELDFGDPENWLFFNENYTSPLRIFRFRHPPVFEVVDLDSSMVWLYKDNKKFLGIEKNYIIEGSTLDDYKKNYEFDKTNNDLDKLDLGRGEFFYRVKTYDEYSKRERYNYSGLIDGHVISILRPTEDIPEDVLVNIIQSIELE